MNAPAYLQERYARAVERSAAAVASPDPWALTESVMGWRELLQDEAAWQYPDLVEGAQIELGHAHFDRWQRVGEPSDLDDAIEAYIAPLAEKGSALPYYHSLMADLAGALLERHKLSGSLADVDASIQAYDVALEDPSSDRARSQGLQANRALAMYHRFFSSRDVADLDTAIATFHRLAEEGDATLRANSLANLGISLRARYQVRGDAADLDDSIIAQRGAIASGQPGTSSWASWQSNLGNALVNRAESVGDRSDLEAAIAAHEAAAAAFPAGSSGWTTSQINLASALGKGFDRFGDEPYLDAAIEICEHALAFVPGESRLARIAATTLAGLLRWRFFQRGATEDVETAVSLADLALSREVEGSRDWLQSLLVVGVVHRLRYATVGSDEDVEIAINALERVIEAAAPGSEPWATAHQGLGEALVTRHKVTADYADLEAGIDAFRAALSSLPPRSAAAGDVAASLAEALDLRFRGPLDAAGVDEAIVLYERAVRTVQRGSLKWMRWRTGLAVARSLRYEVYGDVRDLDEAVATLGDVLTVSSEPTVDWAAAQLELAGVLITRHRAGGQQHDLDGACAAADAALSVASLGRAERSWAYQVSGDARRLRFALGRDPADFAAARDAYNLVAEELESAPMPDRLLGAAAGLGELHAYAGEWARAADCYGRALDFFDGLYATQLLDEGREASLQRLEDLHVRAAYAIARAGDAEDAVVRLERGRARMLGARLARDRADLEGVRAQDPSTYDQYVGATSALRALDSDERSASGGATATGDAAARLRRRRAAQARLDDAVERIRRIPGHERFLAIPSWHEVAEVVAPGAALVYLVATVEGGMALLVDAGPGAGAARSEPVWLDALSGAAVRDLIAGSPGATRDTAWSPAYARWSSADEEDTAADEAWFAVIENVTRQLWDLGMGTLVETLRARGYEEAVLVPAGLLGLLPLHAAWCDDPSAPSGRHAALDEVAFSYAPSALAFGHARRQAERRAEEHLLAVAEPDPVSAGGLPYAGEEVTAIANHFDTTTVLAGNAATRSALLDALPHADVVHLACHGESNPVQPLESALLMAGDEPLAVRDVLALRLEGRLAVLSACETGMVGIKLPDEVVALPAAFLQAGFAGVVASLWSVSDLSTALLMQRFYRLWLEEGQSPARALQNAQRSLRDAADLDFGHPFWWAAFTLTGA
jgi:tetratricopeptide (TPR) repeat protein